VRIVTIDVNVCKHCRTQHNVCYSHALQSAVL
jgi:hypothetical protein